MGEIGSNLQSVVRKITPLTKNMQSYSQEQIALILEGAFDTFHSSEKCQGSREDKC